MCTVRSLDPSHDPLLARVLAHTLPRLRSAPSIARRARFHGRALSLLGDDGGATGDGGGPRRGGHLGRRPGLPGGDGALDGGPAQPADGARDVDPEPHARAHAARPAHPRDRVVAQGQPREAEAEHPAALPRGQRGRGAWGAGGGSGGARGVARSAPGRRRRCSEEECARSGGGVTRTHLPSRRPCPRRSWT